jgi:hypothetical protein
MTKQKLASIIQMGASRKKSSSVKEEMERERERERERESALVRVGTKAGTMLMEKGGATREY